MKRRRADERGAVALLTAGLMLGLVATAALAVDIGMQRVGRTDMQSLADVVALDLSRELDDREVADMEAVEDALIAASLRRNDGSLGDAPDLDADWGEMDNAGEFVTLTESETPTAVRVRASTEVDFAFGIASSGVASRSAVAAADAGACLRVGSYIASLNTAQSALLNSILGGLLGSNVNLQAVGYNGLATSNISLAELVAVGGLGVGTPDELLALEDVKVGDFFLAAAKVLDSQGKGLEANVLRSILVSAGTPTIAVGDLVEASGTNESALTAGLNVLSLVNAAAMLAHEGSAVTVPNLGVNLGLANTTASLQVTEAPQVKCGRAGISVSTAQVKLILTTRINAQTISVPLLNASVALDQTNLTLTVDLGKAIASLKSVTCVEGVATNLRVGLRSGVVGGLTVSASLGLRATVGVPLVGGGSLLNSLLTMILQTLGLDAVSGLFSSPELRLKSTVELSGGVTTGTDFNKTVNVPISDGYTIPTGSGPGDLLGQVGLVPQTATSLVLHYTPLLPLFGPPKDLEIANTNLLFNNTLSPIIARVVSQVLNPLVSTLQQRVVDPLSALLGLQLGGADVWAIPTPQCANPKLVE